METPKLGEILRKLSFIKSYSSLVMPMAILISGLVVFAVAVVLGRSFTQKAQRESTSIGGQVRQLTESAPSIGQVDVEKKYLQEYEKDVNQISVLATQTTQRELLSHKIFPQPKDTSMRIFDEYGRNFQSAIKKLIDDVNGRDCPSQAELDEALQKSVVGRPGTRARSSLLSMSGSEGKIVDGLCLEKANSACVYINPSDLAGYDFWKAYKASTMDAGIKDCWYWQIGYWITEDVLNAIKAMNTGSRNVYDSRVKRLVSLSFASPSKRMTITIRASTRAPADKPIYVVAAKDQLTESPTGRMSNADIDVVHFNLLVFVRSEDVLPFMRELCRVKEHKFSGYSNDREPKTFKHNQITILESKVRSVDPEGQEHRLFRYGDDAVVELDTICEYIFYKSGYEEVKPESVKKELQASPTSTTP